MKSYLVSLAFAICTFGLFAQSQTTNVDVKIGDVFEIGIPKTNAYKHIDIPRPNIIRKRGGFPNHKDVYGTMVVVTDFKEKKDGTIIVIVTPKNGTRFFGSHKFLSANLNAALQAEELIAN